MKIRESPKKCHGKYCPNKDKAFKMFRVKDYECNIHQYSLDNLCVDCETKEVEQVVAAKGLNSPVTDIQILNKKYLKGKL